ncbi:hotdog fold thioesterase [Aestuariicella hydrocarbonica]|uniref:Hotdog fold thioesterase n=1 Tax=Pseudomaricurvus hydrocarbonicus TaxID=1470433 RepID=A0A9E5JX71_9GAMM|nr:hotdog fold thioesterase [Aestuariicella hydrocarbonica]NHO66949.1 hotdog fold thioesterase [Aestuariicella hydrocarbonica]
MSKSIWLHEPNLEELNSYNDKTIHGVLGIEITEIGPDYMRGTLPAKTETFQPMGLIHGGANVVLAESLGSIASNLIVDQTQFYCVGQEVNANHIRGVREGVVTGTAHLLHAGRTSHVWEIKIENEAGKLTCVSRLTMAVVKHS